MLRLILGFFSGPLTRIGEKLIDAKVELAKAETAERKIELETQVAQLEARERVLIAEQGHWLTRLVRPLWAMPFIIYTWKVLVWDMVLGWGTTPPLGQQMAELMTVVAAAYFLARGAEKAVQAWRRK